MPLILLHSLSVSSYLFIPMSSFYIIFLICATFIFQTRPSFIGESGSGKSTLARLLIGLDRPSHGQIFLNDEDTSQWGYDRWRSHRTKIQAVFQDASGSLNKQLSVERNLDEALRNLSGLPKRERKKRLMELMDLTATSRKLLDTPTKNLSGGEQRRVALLRALAVQPDYLILDELTSGLDLISQKAIRKVLEAYHREYRCSYLLITHDMKFAYSLSERIYELVNGQITRIGQSNIDIKNKEDLTYEKIKTHPAACSNLLPCHVVSHCLRGKYNACGGKQ